MFRLWKDARNFHTLRASRWESKSSYRHPFKLGTTQGGTGHTDGFSRSEYRSTTYEYYREEERGYFVAPKTSKYRFYILGDDVATIWLNQNTTSFDESDGMAMVAWSNHATSSFFTSRKTQVSDFIELKQGQRYPFQIRFIEWGGHDYFSVSFGSDEYTLH